MTRTVISIENLSKSYRLGQIGTGTLANDLKVWWAKRWGKPNPTLKIGHKVIGDRDSEILCALRDVSFSVEQGEVLGIIGRNGAGKSTLLKILSRVTAPTAGKIKIKGRIASLLEVGTGFHPDLTGRENIYLNGAILGMTKVEINRKFDEIVGFAEISQFIDTPVKRYSSGMYVRLAFAVAAHLEPEILVVDEVLAVGDAEFQKKCLGKMGDVAKKGRTVLFVSHNMLAIQNLCSRCILFESGSISVSGLVPDVIEHYISLTHQTIQREGGYLSDWMDREGSGRAKLIRFEMLNKEGDTVHEVPFNGYVKFRLTCDFPDLMDAAFGVLIHSTTEVPLIDLRSSNSRFIAEKLRGREVIEVETDALNLYPGDYYLSPWISDKMIKEDLDFVHFCAKIKITMPNDKSQFIKLDPTWGKFVVNSRWNRGI